MPALGASGAAADESLPPPPPFRRSLSTRLRRSISESLRLRRSRSRAAAAAVRQYRSADVVEHEEEVAMPAQFLRRDSLLIQVKPGDPFSPHADVLVAPTDAANADKLDPYTLVRHHLDTGNLKQTKKCMRRNGWSQGHRIRAELWKQICRDSNYDGNRMLYADTVHKLASVAGNSFRPSCVSAANAVVCDHRLNSSGKQSLLKVLTAIEHVRTDITYVPALYPLCAVFLHYMDEGEAFACVIRLLNAQQMFLLQTDVSTVASRRTLLHLLRKHDAATLAAMQRALDDTSDETVVTVLRDWKCWIWRDLPFGHLVRVVDCFLVEGRKVVVRVALALLRLWRKHRLASGGRLKARTAAQLADDIADFCRAVPVVPRKLLKAAFAIRNLKTSQIVSAQEKHELWTRKHGCELVESASAQSVRSSHAPHHFADIQLDSDVVPPQARSMLWSWLPDRVQLMAAERVYSLRHDGTSFTHFWPKVEVAEQSLLLIESACGQVFGAYCSASWAERRRAARGGASYFGTGESFVLRLGEKAAKFGWVGVELQSVSHAQQLFLAAGDDWLTIGGGCARPSSDMSVSRAAFSNGAAVSIRDELVSGESARCDTFDNPPLCPSGHFEIKELEVHSLL